MGNRPSGSDRQRKTPRPIRTRPKHAAVPIRSGGVCHGMPAGRTVGVAVGGPERKHARTERFKVAGADESWFAGEVYQERKATRVRHTGVGNLRAGRPPGRAGKRQEALWSGLPRPRSDLLSAERRLLLAGPRGRARERSDAGSSKGVPLAVVS